MDIDDRQTVVIHWDERALARGEAPRRPEWVEVNGHRYHPAPETCTFCGRPGGPRGPGCGPSSGCGI